MSHVTLAVGTQKGLFVFKSDDGHAFRLDKHHLPGWEVSAVLLRPNADTLDLLVGTTHYAYGPVIRRSRDGGATWTQPEARPAYPTGSAFKTNRIWQLTRAADGTLYAGVDEAGLFKSSDDGDSWHEVDSLTSHPSRPHWQPGGGGLCLHTIVHDHSNPDRMWLGISAVGVFRTLDRGRSWHPAVDGLKANNTGSQDPHAVYCIHKIVQHPTRSDTLYMQFHGGVYVTHDGATMWAVCESGLPSNFGFPIAVVPDGTLIVAPLDSDERRYFPEGTSLVYRSTDGAASWQPATGVTGGKSFAAVLRDAMTTCGDTGVYLGTTSGEVATSADRGQTWTTLDVTLPRVLCVRAIET